VAIDSIQLMTDVLGLEARAKSEIREGARERNAYIVLTVLDGILRDSKLSQSLFLPLLEDRLSKEKISQGARQPYMD